MRILKRSGSENDCALAVEIVGGTAQEMVRSIDSSSSLILRMNLTSASVKVVVENSVTEFGEEAEDRNVGLGADSCMMLVDAESLHSATSTRMLHPTSGWAEAPDTFEVAVRKFAEIVVV